VIAAAENPAPDFFGRHLEQILLILISAENFSKQIFILIFLATF
jgi:hypothetical protein